MRELRSTGFGVALEYKRSSPRGLVQLSVGQDSVHHDLPKLLQMLRLDSSSWLSLPSSSVALLCSHPPLPSAPRAQSSKELELLCLFIE